MTFKCSSCGFEEVPNDDIQQYSAHLMEGGGTVTIIWYVCVYCRLDEETPIPVSLPCLSSTSNLKEIPYVRQKT